MSRIRGSINLDLEAASGLATEKPEVKLLGKEGLQSSNRR